MGSVSLKSRGGLSLHRDIRKLTLSRIDEFRPKVNYVDQVVNLLTQAGFTIEAQTDVGVSFSGPKDIFQSEFNVIIAERRRCCVNAAFVRRRFLFIEQANRNS